MQSCNGTDLQHQLYSHFLFDVMRSTSHGYIEELRFKQNHKFDINKMTLGVNPITCYSGKVVVIFFWKEAFVWERTTLCEKWFYPLTCINKTNCVYVLQTEGIYFRFSFKFHSSSYLTAATYNYRVIWCYLFRFSYADTNRWITFCFHEGYIFQPKATTDTNYNNFFLS